VDPVRLAMARYNLGDGAHLCRADALKPVTRDAVVLADPGRRGGGRRRFDPRNYLPALDALIDAYRGRDMIVKCAPGIDFDAVTRLGFTGEIEVTSYRGSVREACLWSAGVAESGVRRRASILDRGEQITDAEPDDCPVRGPGRWIVDPDGAVVRAGLVRHFAARHGLWQLDPHIAYLSGDELPAGLRGFEVLGQLAFDERRLRQALSALDCGALEILVRGVDVDPDALRRRLALRGSRPLTVVITRIGSGASARGTAFVCRPSR
ncbi:MAG: class I SAM-dependent methyltransferase, partial [Mycobacterium sp.]